MPSNIMCAADARSVCDSYVLIFAPLVSSATECYKSWTRVGSWL